MITLSASRGHALLRRLALPGARWARPALVPAEAGRARRRLHLAPATPPRLRYDQLMRFGWKILLPVATLNALVTAPRGGRELMANPVPTRSRVSASRSSRSSRSRSRSSTRSTSDRSTRASAAGTVCTGTRTGSRSASAARSAPPPARPTASASSRPRTRRTNASRPASATRGSTRSTCAGASSAATASSRARSTRSRSATTSRSPSTTATTSSTRRTCCSPSRKRVPVADRDLYDTPVPVLQDHS